MQQVSPLKIRTPEARVLAAGRRAARRFARGATVVFWFAWGCGTAAPPPDAEYPALVMPARSPSPAPARSAHPAPPPSVFPGPGAAVPAPLAVPPGPPGQVGSDRSQHGDLPDPEPLVERAWWSYPVSYDRGAIVVGQPDLVCVPRPLPTARRIGRFAFELWLGRELIDRLRFDFPLLASEEPREGSRRPLHETPRFAPGARVSVTLRVPASERATGARILDRATGDTIAVTWPPPSSDGVARPRECPTGPSPTTR